MLLVTQILLIPLMLPESFVILEFLVGNLQKQESLFLGYQDLEEDFFQIPYFPLYECYQFDAEQLLGFFSYFVYQDSLHRDFIPPHLVLQDLDF